MFLHRIGLIATHGCRCSASLPQLLASRNWSALLAAFEQSTLPFDSPTLSAALWALSAAGQASKANELLQKASAQCVSLSESHYTAVIEGAIRAKKQSLAANVYYQSQVFGVTIDTAASSELIRELAKCEAGIENVEYIFEQTVKSGMQPTARACKSFLKLAIGSTDWSTASRILRLMHLWHMELPRKVVDLAFDIERSSEDFKEFQQLWAQISDSAEGEDVALAEEADEKKDPLQLPKDLLKLPLSFQLIMLPRPAKQRNPRDDEN